MATFKIRNSTNTDWIDATTNGLSVRNQSNSGWISKSSGLSGVSVRNSTNTGWITFGPTLSYSISPSTSSVNEGGTVTFNITTAAFGSGTLYWTNAGTTTGADFSDTQNSGSVVITSNSGSFTRTLNNDVTTEGTETIIIQLRTGSTSGPVVATASTVSVIDSSTTSTFPSSLTFTRNNLEFLYSDYKYSSASTAWMELIYTMDTTNFFNVATDNDVDHIVLAALDPRGDSSVYYGGTRDHCGQILRHDQPLWDGARGFILFRSGRFASEHWYDGAGAGFGTDSFGFNPVTNPIFTVRIRAGYRAGTYGDKMEIDIFQGTSTAGTLLTGQTEPWGWDYTGQHRFAIAAIASGYVPPESTGCIETNAAGSKAGATIGISNLTFNVYNA